MARMVGITITAYNGMQPPLPSFKKSKFRGFIIICLLVVGTTVICLYLQNSFQAFTILPRGKPKALLEREFNFVFKQEPGIDLKHIARFEKLHKKYLKRLESIGRHKYPARKRNIFQGETVSEFLPKSRSSVRNILQWTSFYDVDPWIPERFTCPGNLTCISTRDKSDSNLLNSDAVIMHSRNINSGDLPTKRLPYQRWVLFNLEPPHLMWMDYPRYNGLFNWTMTYRTNADFRLKYSNFYKRQIPLTEDEFQNMFATIMSSKSKLSYQMTSSCVSERTNRLHYAADLAKVMSVDMYGKCGNLTCEKKSKICDEKRESYKFFLAMENSNCRDYITEKPAVALYKYSSVPIVMGGADPGDYEGVLPPGSYIHTSGFNSTKDLAEYIELLDKIPYLYQLYHRWRINYTGSKSKLADFCELCSKLHNPSEPVQIYTDFEGWVGEDACDISRGRH